MRLTTRWTPSGRHDDPTGVELCRPFATSRANRQSLEIRPRDPPPQDSGIQGQIVEQCPGIPQIGGVEALGEPAVTGGEKLVRLGAPVLLAPQPGEARRGAQLPRFGTLLSSQLQGLLKSDFALRKLVLRLQ